MSTWWAGPSKNAAPDFKHTVYLVHVAILDFKRITQGPPTFSNQNSNFIR